MWGIHREYPLVGARNVPSSLQHHENELQKLFEIIGLVIFKSALLLSLHSTVM